MQKCSKREVSKPTEICINSLPDMYSVLHAARGFFGWPLFFTRQKKSLSQRVRRELFLSQAQGGGLGIRVDFWDQIEHLT
jgi:hypothetical protein